MPNTLRILSPFDCDLPAGRHDDPGRFCAVIPYKPQNTGETRGESNYWTERFGD
jgi:hypothetical protein